MTLYPFFEMKKNQSQNILIIGRHVHVLACLVQWLKYNIYHLDMLSVNAKPGCHRKGVGQTGIGT